MDTRLDGEQREFVENIRCSGDALLTIINDVLDYSKIEAGKLSVDNMQVTLTSPQLDQPLVYALTFSRAAQ